MAIHLKPSAHAAPSPVLRMRALSSLSNRHLLSKSLSSVEGAFDTEPHDEAPDTLKRIVGVSKAVQRFKGLLKEKKVQDKHMTALEVLDNTSPFLHLPGQIRKNLAPKMTAKAFKEDQVILGSSGDTERHVYILADGQIIGSRETKPKLFLTAPATLGFNEILIGTPVALTFKAVTPVLCYLLPADELLSLLSHSAFNYAMIKEFKYNQKLFRSLEAFITHVSNAFASGIIVFEEVLAKYRRIQNIALHSRKDSEELDVEGWMYAARRLPENITTTYVVFFTTVIPPQLCDPAIMDRRIITAVRDKLSFFLTSIAMIASGRRRMIFQLREGKDLVLIREDYSDPLDFISCLCLHTCEAEKLRKRFFSPNVSSLLQVFVHAHQTETLEQQLEVLSRLPLSKHEQKGLLAIWPKDVLHRCWEMVLHHENFSLSVDIPPNYAVDALEKWSREIRLASVLLMGDLDDVEVDIISSNTHSVGNCLSSWLHQHANEILAWGASAHPEIDKITWHNVVDKLYALTPLYFKLHPELSEQCAHADLAQGIITLAETELTGIQVNLIDTSKLHGAHIDPLLRTEEKRMRRLIVNIDYAFGKQAEDIISTLILLFSTNIRSINVLGKAGAFQGSRGDIIMARHLVLQDSEDVTHINNAGLTRQGLEQLSGRKVWAGGVLTVKGTLLQNRQLLMYYKTLWRCVSLEMEGSYYARCAQKMANLGFLRPDVAHRYLYYVSDLPLDTASNLSTGMTVEELVAPLYATTRAFLKPILAAAVPEWNDGTSYHPPALASHPVQGVFFTRPESADRLDRLGDLQHL